MEGEEGGGVGGGGRKETGIHRKKKKRGKNVLGNPLALNSSKRTA